MTRRIPIDGTLETRGRERGEGVVYRSEDSGRVSSEGFLAQVRKCCWKLGIVVPENATIWPSKEVIILLLFFVDLLYSLAETSRNTPMACYQHCPTLVVHNSRKKKMVVHHGHALRWR